MAKWFSDDSVTAKWFSDAEIAGLDQNLVKMLDSARGFAKTPFIITSGLRTPLENQAAGGVLNSAHTRGLAVDLACAGSRTRFHMVAALLLAGFRRIEIADRHIHVDIDESKPMDVMWLDKSH